MKREQAIAIAEEHEARVLFTGLYRAYLVGELRENGDHSAADSVMYDIRSIIAESGYSDSSFYWIASALAFFELHQYDTAAVLWKKILEPEPNHFPSLMYLGMSYLDDGQIGNAVSTLEKASKLYDFTRGGTPDMGVHCYYQLGKAYEASGWTDKAIEQYETFLDIWKDADQGIAEMKDAGERLARLKSKS